jgi:hypothetical protein
VVRPLISLGIISGMWIKGFCRLDANRFDIMRVGVVIHCRKEDLMADTGLLGPHPLNSNRIDGYVGDGIGAYALGSANINGGLDVRYVGRSDNDLNTRLKNWIGSYTHFKFGHFKTREGAFNHECRMFHDFGGVQGLDNSIHPARPAGATYGCPHCRMFD